MSCTGKYTVNHSTALEKNVPRGMTECPDCKAILVWRYDKHRHNIKDAISISNLEAKYANALTGH